MANQGDGAKSVHYIESPNKTSADSTKKNDKHAESQPQQQVEKQAADKLVAESNKTAKLLQQGGKSETDAMARNFPQTARPENFAAKSTDGTQRQVQSVLGANGERQYHGPDQNGKQVLYERDGKNLYEMKDGKRTGERLELPPEYASTAKSAEPQSKQNVQAEKAGSKDGQLNRDASSVSTDKAAKQVSVSGRGTQQEAQAQSEKKDTSKVSEPGKNIEPGKSAESMRGAEANKGAVEPKPLANLEQDKRASAISSALGAEQPRNAADKSNAASSPKEVDGRQGETTRGSDARNSLKGFSSQDLQSKDIQRGLDGANRTQSEGAAGKRIPDTIDQKDPGKNPPQRDLINQNKDQGAGKAPGDIVIAANGSRTSSGGGGSASPESGLGNKVIGKPTEGTKGGDGVGGGGGRRGDQAEGKPEGKDVKAEGKGERSVRDPESDKVMLNSIRNILTGNMFVLSTW